jgi:hypothetical protein
MTRKQALIELRDKVKAGDAAEVAGCLGRMVVFDTPWDFASQAISAHRGSLDAAKALHEAVLPGWGCEVCSGWEVVLRQYHRKISAKHTSPARAWLLAILEALIAQEPDT